MKTIILVLLINCFFSGITAQNVGIGTSTPHNSAALEISSSNKGLLLPRITDTSAISTPAKGLAVYATNNNKLWYYDGTRWQQAMAHAGGMDSIWYKTQDSIVYTTKTYVGINSNLSLLPPQANLQATGNLLVQANQLYSSAAPTPAQTFTMDNNPVAQFISYADSVGRIYDPGGTGNYSNNMQGNVIVALTVGHGILVRSAAADFGIGTGDTLWVSYTAYPSCRSNYIYRFTNTTVNPEDFVLPGNTTVNYNVLFIFRSNADGNNNKGFNFTITRLYGNGEPVKKIKAVGPSLYFNSTNAAFAAGYNNTATGAYSAAFGYNCTALGSGTFVAGEHAFAAGFDAIAMGPNASAIPNYSVAIGNGVTAAAPVSLAMGNNTTAGGIYSTAFGNNTTTSLDYATAFGNGTIASGYGSTSMGQNTKAKSYLNTAIGRNNTDFGNSSTWVNTDPIFTIGNGTENGASSNAFTVLKNGQTGINIDVPFTDLHIVQQSDNGLDKTRGIRLQRSVNNNQWRTLIDPNNNYIFEYNNSLYSYIEPTGGTFVAGSDERIKKDIRPMEDMLGRIMLLRPKTYHYTINNDNDPRLYGFLAQDVEKLFPDFVFSSGEGIKGISYSNFSVIAIKAIQQQQSVIEELKKRLEVLEGKK